MTDDFVPMNYRHLPDATDEEIRRAIQPGNNIFVSQTDLLAELDRRLTRAQGDRMERLTEEVRDLTDDIRRLTWAVLIVAIAAGVVAFVALLVSLR